jgi:hypothetical protein
MSIVAAVRVSAESQHVGRVGHDGSPSSIAAYLVRVECRPGAGILGLDLVSVPPRSTKHDMSTTSTIGNCDAPSRLSSADVGCARPLSLGLRSAPHG